MWWKTLSIVLLVYVILAGFLVPLKSGIERAEPYAVRAGDTVIVSFYGYNTQFATPLPKDAPIRVWLSYNEQYAMAGAGIRAVNDTVLEATFAVPASLPEGKTNAYLNVIVDHPASGASILPSGVEMRAAPRQEGEVLTAGWTENPVKNLHVQKGFSFPYQNIIYETIRNTYFHVPMWFALLFLLTASVWHSIAFLRSGKSGSDIRAAAYAEAGLLFGLLGLVTGMVWAQFTWGKAWSNDIKQLMTAVALLIYMAYFVLRSSFDDPEKGARLSAVYNIFAFASLIPLLYIVPRMFDSLHPGATGNPAFGSQDLDNTMRLVFYPAVIGWTLLGFWIADLHIRYKKIGLRLLDLD